MGETETPHFYDFGIFKPVTKPPNFSSPINFNNQRINSINSQLNFIMRVGVFRFLKIRYVEGDLLIFGYLMLDDALSSFTIGYLMFHDTFPSLPVGYLIFDDSLS